MTQAIQHHTEAHHSAAAELLREAAAALASDATTAQQISLLLHRITAAETNMAELAKAATERAHDPFLADTDASRERQNAEHADWQCSRLRTMRQRVEQAAQSARERDKQRELRVAYVAAQALRDKAASRVRAEYPELAHKLAALAREIAEADQAVSRVNAPGRLPSGAEALNRVEGHVFGWNDAFAGNHPAEVRVCRIAAVVLPDPDAAACDSFPIWPPRLGIGNQSIPRPDIRHVLSAINPQPVRYW